MLPIYFIVGLINIFSQHHNYGIKIEDPNFDVRVRRSVEDTAKPLIFSRNNNVKKYLKTDVLNAISPRRIIEDINVPNNLKTDVLKRKKRYAYYKKTIITNNDLYRFNNTQENKNNGSQTRNGNPYDIFNPNWNFLFNRTRNNSNNSGVHNGIINNNNRPIIRSYPYGYPPGYGPRTNTATESTGIPTTPGYRNQNKDNAPYYYNYQNPERQNFAGYTKNTSGLNNYTPGYNNIPVPYAPEYNRPNNTGINNNALWTSPLAAYPDNLSPYAPNFNNGPATPNNTFVSHSPVNNTYSLVNNTYSPANNTYSPVNNTYSPVNNNYSPVNNTYVTQSNLNSTGATTEKIILSGCVICNIPCPRFMKRFGSFCVSDYDE